MSKNNDVTTEAVFFFVVTPHRESPNTSWRKIFSSTIRLFWSQMVEINTLLFY